MNAERLHAGCIEIVKAISATGLIEKLNSLVTTPSPRPAKPAPPPQIAAEALGALRITLGNFPTDSYSPAWQQLIDEIGARDMLGQRLLERIEKAVASHNISPAKVIEDIKAIVGQVTHFSQVLDATAKGMDFLHVRSGELEPGQCEVGILVPRSAFHDSMREFGSELEELSFILETFAEVSTGDAKSVQIKSISSSDILIALTAAPLIAASVAHAVEKVIGLYKTVLEIQKLRQDLAKYRIDADKAGLSQRTNEVMTDGIAALTEELMAGCHKACTAARRNELSNKVSISLRKLASRVDQGYNIEVRFALPAAQEDSGPSNEERTKPYESIQAASKELLFMRASGGRVLHLTDADRKDEGAGSGNAAKDS
jgi:hypothetical protein